MRPTLPLLAAVLAACSQPDDLQLASPAASSEAEVSRAPALLEAGGPVSAARMAQAPTLVGPELTSESPLVLAGSFYQVPPILEEFWRLPLTPPAPEGLLADPNATQDDFEEWYAGASDYQVVTTHRRLAEHLGARELHPNELTTELEFLVGEVGRRAQGRALTHSVATGPRDYTAEYRGRDLDFVSFRHWELGHELNAYRQEAWQNGGGPIIL